MEEEAIWVSINSEGETVYIEENYFEEYEEELMNMRSYLLENFIGASDFENETFELPFLGKTIVYSFEINPDFSDESFRYS